MYLEGHHSTRLHITESEESGGESSIGVEESPQFASVLGELGVIGNTAVVLQVVIQNMDGFRGEQLGNLCILVDHISQIGLLDIGILTSVSDSGVEHSHG